MILSRHVLKYLYIYYLPSGLFVVVSWVGFLIPPEVVPDPSAIKYFCLTLNIFVPLGCAWPHGDADHSLPRADQHLQHRHHQLPQRGGHDRHRYSFPIMTLQNFSLDHRSLDAGLHLLCLRCLSGIRLPPLEEEEELSEEEEEQEADRGGGETEGHQEGRL